MTRRSGATRGTGGGSWARSAPTPTSCGCGRVTPRRHAAGSGARRPGRRVRNVLLRDLIRTDRVESMEYLQRIARTRRQLIADVEGSEPETAGILLAHIDELGQALNQHYRPAQPRFSDDSDQ